MSCAKKFFLWAASVSQNMQVKIIHRRHTNVNTIIVYFATLLVTCKYHQWVLQQNKTQCAKYKLMHNKFPWQHSIRLCIFCTLVWGYLVVTNRELYDKWSHSSCCCVLVMKMSATISTTLAGHSLLGKTSFIVVSDLLHCCRWCVWS